MKLFLMLIFFLIAGDKIMIEDAWIRNSSKNSNSALFFNVVNNSNEPDTLYNVTSNLAKMTEIHETFEDGDMMGMRRVENIVIKGNSTFKFKPRGFHIMLIRLKEDLIEGENGEVTLYFKKAGIIKVTAPIKK